MAQQWYEPFSFTEWIKRTFSILNIIVAVITITFIVSEFRFDWFENLVGTYLAGTNASRPQKGPIWETGQQASSAQQYLNNIISQKEETQKNVSQAVSFIDLSSNIKPGEWVTLEKQELKKLYLNAHRSTADRIIEPAYLLWVLNDRALDRIFCEGTLQGFNLYFIDSQNRVIKKIELSRDDISSLVEGIRPVPGSLEDMPEFSGRIFTADDFFKGLFKLPSDIIPDLISHPEVLLNLEGQITHVGIWNESQDGYIRIGFEISLDDGSQVVFMNGREWAVWQLSLNLKGESG